MLCICMGMEIFVVLKYCHTKLLLSDNVCGTLTSLFQHNITIFTDALQQSEGLRV